MKIYIAREKKYIIICVYFNITLTLNKYHVLRKINEIANMTLDGPISGLFNKS